MSRVIIAAMEINNSLFEESLERVKHQVSDPHLGLFGPGSMVWRLGSSTMTGFHGSGRALLLQIAHPWVTQGINEHSSTRHDPLGRASRTFRAVFSITFGSLDQAIDEARRVHRVHKRIQGELDGGSSAFAKGSAYSANNAEAMLWVHATLWDTLVRMHEWLIEPLSLEEKERFYQETKLFAYMFGIPQSILPESWSDFEDYNQRMWDSGVLSVNDATRELARFLFEPVHPIFTPLIRHLKTVTAFHLPDHLREGFSLSLSSGEIRKMDRRVFVAKKLHAYGPRFLTRGPSYLEARRRIQGLPPLRVTQALNKRMFGKAVLVG